MIARVLPFEEWNRLGDTDLPTLLPYVEPANASVVVVEEQRKVIASLAVIRATHFEGAWIDPAHRGNLGVTRALLRLATEQAQQHGEKWIFGGASDTTMQDILGRMGGVRMPMELYALWIGSQECRQQ